MGNYNGEFVFKDRVGLKKGLERVSVLALNQTMRQMYAKLLDIIEEDVYKNAYHTIKHGSTWGNNNDSVEEIVTDDGEYERTEDLMSAFKLVEGKESGGLNIRSSSAKIELNTKAITYGKNALSHGVVSFFGAENFLSMLNNDIGQGDIFPHVYREPFWDDFLSWANENFELLYQENLNKLMGSKGVYKSRQGISTGSITVRKGADYGLINNWDKINKINPWK